MHLPYRFGRYVLVKKIAQGGMAEIFKAQYLGESGFSKDVCIKRLLPVWSDNPLFINMLIDEAKALVHLSHPNIVQVFELGRDGKSFYISMELIDGVDLKKLFLETTAGGEPLPLKFTFYIIAEVLKALRFAHQKINLVHRDISPQNILLSFDGQVKVADFGIAKGIHRSIETTQHQVKGKYSYMSPEQARGEKVDARTDLYAVGILLYELLEGRRLFDGINDLATLEQVRESRLPDEALKRRPARLRAIVFKALQKEARYRYQNADDFLKEIHCETTPEEFSQYLKEIFPNKDFGETDAEIFVPKETIGKPSSAKKEWRSLCGVFVMLLLSLIGKDSLHFIATSEAASSLVPSVMTPGTKLPLLGSVTIDAKPKVMEGILKIDGGEEKFKTPFHLGKLDLTQAKEGVVVFRTKEGKTIEEKFVVNAEEPNFIKTFYFEEEKPGVLKISAKPWGSVTIPGIVAQKETPLTGLSLKAGKYRLKVAYPPTSQSAEKEIELASGAEIICHADFSSAPSLICR